MRHWPVIIDQAGFPQLQDKTEGDKETCTVIGKSVVYFRV